MSYLESFGSPPMIWDPFGYLV